MSFLPFTYGSPDWRRKHENERRLRRVLQMRQNAATQLDALALTLKAQIETERVIKTYRGDNGDSTTIDVRHIMQQHQLQLNIVKRGGISLKVLANGGNQILNKCLVFAVLLERGYPVHSPRLG